MPWQKRPNSPPKDKACLGRQVTKGVPIPASPPPTRGENDNENEHENGSPSAPPTQDSSPSNGAPGSPKIEKETTPPTLSGPGPLAIDTGGGTPSASAASASPSPSAESHNSNPTTPKSNGQSAFLAQGKGGALLLVLSVRGDKYKGIL